MLNNAQQYLVSAPWLAIFPGVVITRAVAASTLWATASATRWTIGWTRSDVAEQQDRPRL